MQGIRPNSSVALDGMKGEEILQALANSAAFWVLAVLALVVLYLLPTLIGMIRRVDRLALVFLVNLIGAPTGIGWFAAMILAFGPRRLPAPPPVSCPRTSR
jgi:Superinfection immunity protein